MASQSKGYNRNKKYLFPERNGHKFVYRPSRHFKKFENVLCVDPGLGGTGWAFFKTLLTKHKFKSNTQCPPDVFDVFKPYNKSENHQWIGKSYEIANYMFNVIAVLRVNWLIIEFPEVWGSSLRSQVSSQKGNLHKLSFLIGMICDAMRVQGRERVPILVTPNEWKGQLSKEAVIRRIELRFPHLKDMVQDHEADAIGIGMAAQGIL